MGQHKAIFKEKRLGPNNYRTTTGGMPFENRRFLGKSTRAELTSCAYGMCLKATEWIEANAPGTKKGWRWQKNWTGLYCILVEERVTQDNWKNE